MNRIKKRSQQINTNDTQNSNVILEKICGNLLTQSSKVMEKV